MGCPGNHKRQAAEFPSNVLRNDVQVLQATLPLENTRTSLSPSGAPREEPAPENSQPRVLKCSPRLTPWLEIRKSQYEAPGALSPLVGSQHHFIEGHRECVHRLGLPVGSIAAVTRCRHFCKPAFNNHLTTHQISWVRSEKRLQIGNHFCEF